MDPKTANSPKKKADKKFKQAGPGHRLTDNTASVSPASSSKSSGRKVEPPPVQSQKPRSGNDSMEEKRQAAMAALARQEKVKPKTSTAEDLIAHRQLAFIKEQARKEIEAEKHMKELELTGGQNSSQPTHKKNVEQENFTTDAAIGGLVDPAYYAVSGVFFSCPIIGPQVLPRDEILELIREFLFSQPKEEMGITSCLIIHSCNKNYEKVRVCIETLCKYIENIIKNPEDPKYKKIRCSNKVFQEKVGNVSGAFEFLEACGFDKVRMKTEGSDSQDEDFWVFSDDEQKSFVPKLTELSDVLKSTTPIKPVLDRNLQVLMPAQVSERRELPPDFYQLTGEELKLEQQRRTKFIEKELTLRTKAQRENDERREQRLYRFAVLRIRFPDGFTLQGTFRSTEKLGDLYEFVQENLAFDDAEFVLKRAGGEILTNLEATLSELRLPPASIVNFKLETAVSPVQGEFTFLKPEILALLHSM